MRFPNFLCIPCCFCLFLALSSSLHAGTYGPEQGFIENKGQVLNQFNEPNNEVLFLYSGRGIKIQLRKSGYSYELFQVNNPGPFIHGKCSFDASGPQNVSIKSQRLDVNFIGTNPHPVVLKEKEHNDYLTYYTGGKETGLVHSYDKVTYKNVFKNTDIEFTFCEKESNPLKYNIILHPGARLEDLQFLVKGAENIISRKDSLLFDTPFGKILETIPLSYYTDAPSSGHLINFQLNSDTLTFSGEQDPSRTLVIDPVSNLIWSTYYGGSSLDYCTSTGVDAQNNVYLAGHCLSTTNIATNGSYQSVLNGSLDAYLAKFDLNGVRLWATYFGGSSYEQIFSMYVEPTGSIYLSGDTNSPSNVASPGAYQTIYGGGIDDVLLIKFDPSGQRLWSTYYGGTEHDISQALTVDKNGDIIIAGHTQSIGTMASQGAYNPFYLGVEDVFIAKFSPSGNRVWGTYYGDTDIEEAYGLTSDPSGNIYVTGMTQSISNISNASGYQINPGGLKDGFLAKFNSAGNNLIWGTYYGGSGDDKGTAVKVSNNGNVVLCGNTTSSSNIAGPTAYQTFMGSADDAFFASFSQSGARLLGSYFGGNNVDYIESMVVDQNSNIVFCGETISSNSISTSGAYQDTICTGNDYDAYFAKFSASGNRILSSYFGGPTNDYGHAIALDQTGKIYLAGETTSTVDIATAGSHQAAIGGSQDAFLAKFCIPVQPFTLPAGTTTLCMGTDTLKAQPGYSTYLWNNVYTTNPLIVTYTTQGFYYYTVFVADGFGCSGSSDSLRIYVENCYVSVPEMTDGQGIAVYPVPSMDYINLLADAETANIEIYSSSGQLVLKLNLREPPFLVDIKTLPPGVYLLLAKLKGNSFEKKFIKE